MKFFVIFFIFIGFTAPIFAQDQLLAQNPDEPNSFGYFVLAMSVFIIASIVILKFKNWRNKK